MEPAPAAKNGKIDLGDLQAALAEAEKQPPRTPEAIFKEALQELWGENARYDPPVRIGTPRCIVLLYEQKEDKEGTAETEKFLEKLFCALALKDVWVVDIHVEQRTQYGATATSPQRQEKCGRWVRKLVRVALESSTKLLQVAAFKPALIIYSKLVEDGVGRGFFTQIPVGTVPRMALHPSCTANSGGGRPVFIQDFGAAWAEAKLHPQVNWASVVDDFKCWTTDEWYARMVAHLRKKGPGVYVPLQEFQGLCPPYCLPAPNSQKVKVSKFNTWLRSQSYPDLEYKRSKTATIHVKKL